MDRKTLILITLALVASLASFAGATEHVVPAAEFNLDDYAGKVVVVDFWASWCPPCLKAMPFLSDMQAKYGEQGLVTIAVTVDQDPKAPGKMIATLQDDIIVVRDHEGLLARQYKISSIPAAFVIDREGNTVSTHVGFQDSEKKGREEELVKLLAVE